MARPWPRAVRWAGRAEVGKQLPSQVLWQAEGVMNCKREREATVTHCPRPSAANPPTSPPDTARAMSCTTHLCCYKCTLYSPSCLSQAGLGETLVILWDGHKELLPAAPQHNSSNLLSAPSLAAMLNWSPVMSARWPLPEPKSVERGLARSQSSALLTSQPLGR